MRTSIFSFLNSETQFKILYEQFIQKIYLINFDILSIDGDIFDKKFMERKLEVITRKLTEV